MISRYYKNERVQQSLYYPGTFCGLHPALASGFISFLGYSEHEGVWYPRGGMIRIPEALRCCGERYGLEVCLEQRVDRVLVCG
ncbi:MAG: hypothetical protein SWK76_10750 [Actinomycetota bacterium]|nr:hypothetical protein [Actinomycetota bacterium]